MNLDCNDPKYLFVCLKNLRKPKRKMKIITVKEIIKKMDENEYFNVIEFKIEIFLEDRIKSLM